MIQDTRENTIRKKTNKTSTRFCFFTFITLFIYTYLYKLSKTNRQNLIFSIGTVSPGSSKRAFNLYIQKGLNEIQPFLESSQLFPSFFSMASTNHGIAGT